MTDELVALVDEDGQVVGSAPRSVVRRDNLLHSATAVLVRDPERRIYVHRRSDTKDWAPGRWDVAAGGVMTMGEEPLASARRELEEELGVVVDTMLELGTHLYEDDTTRCFEYAFEAVWDGPLRHQPEEVAEGRWVTSAELAAMLSDTAYLFVPDSRQLLDRLAARGISDYRELTRGGG